jgi:hypothetical protein
MRGTDPIKSKWVCLKIKNLCLRFSFIVILYLIIYVAYLIILCIIIRHKGVVLKLYVFLHYNSMKLGKILSKEKLDVI